MTCGYVICTMVDKLNKDERSRNMRAIKSTNTGPEVSVRKLLTKIGYRYRIHLNYLPGKPDLAFINRKKAIFVHGCFWHHHEGCARATVPEIEYWQRKLERNQVRDRNNLAQLKSSGWQCEIIWECELKALSNVEQRLVEFIGPVHYKNSGEAMSISFSNICKGNTYSRKQLAELWNYSSYQALARGVVTPKGDNKIVLFVTEEKQTDSTQYQDKLTGNILDWEGPTDRFAEARILNAKVSDDEIHLFYRRRHHTNFVYVGLLSVIESTLHENNRSFFRFKVMV